MKLDPMTDPICGPPADVSTVLLVEDDEMVRETIALWLKSLGAC